MARVKAGFFFGDVYLRLVTPEGDDLRVSLTLAQAETLSKEFKRTVNSAKKGQPEG